MTNPNVLLFDEPTAGIHPKIVAYMANKIRSLSRSGKTSIVVSHDIPSVMALCGRIVVLDAGAIVADPAPSEIVREKAVVEAYLGE